MKLWGYLLAARLAAVLAAPMGDDGILKAIRAFGDVMRMLTALMLAAIGLADMVSGIFKSNGVLGGLLLDFEPRPRPMFTPSLEGLDITPDSLRVMRREAVPRHWAVHVPPEAVSGMYGTVSAHAATIVALAVLACGAIRRRWFTGLMVVCSVVICYSRIYLGKHFPMDLVWGTLVGAILGWTAYQAYRKLSCQKKELQ